MGCGTSKIDPLNNTKAVAASTENKKGIRVNTHDDFGKTTKTNQTTEESAKPTAGPEKPNASPKQINEGAEKITEPRSLRLYTSEEHEARAKVVEERWANANREKADEGPLKELGLPAITVSDVPQDGADSKEYTVLDLSEHNKKAGTKDWFKYGHGIYSAQAILPYVEGRMREYQTLKSKEEDYMGAYYAGSYWQHHLNNPNPCRFRDALMQFKKGPPVYTAKYYGVTRQELKAVLAVCRMGSVVDVDRDAMLTNIKKGVEDTLETLGEMGESKYTDDFRDQLKRWLYDYPSVQIYNQLPPAGVDPNTHEFKLPKTILMLDPEYLQTWIKEWEPFETGLGETGVGWNVIEEDIVKNDTTTEEQDKTWGLRARNKNINNPTWIAKRRGKVTSAFMKRNKLGPNVVTPFLNFCDNMENAWKQFQALVEKDT